MHKMILFKHRPAAQAEASAEDLNTVFDFLNSF